MKILFNLIILVLACGSAAAQLTVTGKIVDSTSGDPLPGVTVSVKNQKGIGTVSDIDGAYMLKVPDGATLMFSYVGYNSQEVAVKGRKVIDVALVEDAQSLNEIVVVGYGTMRKSDLTGSVVKADLGIMKDSPNTNVVQSLHGTVAGLEVGQVNRAGGDPTMQLRGQSTINGNTGLLIVLDGVVYNGSMSDINPADISSIEILKDASSKAVYGAKASNGVVMVSTKSGSHASSPRITYSSNWSFSNPTKNHRPLNREEYLMKLRDVNYEKAFTQESGYTSVNPDWDFSGTQLTTELMDGIAAGTDYDWWGDIKRTGHLFTNNVSVEGGTEKVSYFLSGSFSDQGAVIKNDNFKRTSFRTNVDVKLTPWLKVGTNTFISYMDYSGESPQLASLMKMPNIVAPKDADGEWITSPTGKNTKNPYFAYLSDDVDKRQQVNTSVYGIVDFPFLKDLSYRINYNYTSTSARRYNYNKYEASEKGEASKEYSNVNYWLLDNILSYSNDFGDHHVDATLVYGCNRRYGDGTLALGQQFATSATSFNDLAQAIIQKISSSAWRESNIYMMARGAYNYNGGYYVTATIRRDGFSGFAENHKFGCFPSFGLGWRISQERFMHGLVWLDNLKARVSYGVTGNQTNRYSSLAKVILGGDYSYVFGDGGTPALGSNVTTMGNSDLKWETTREWNAGIDFAVLDNRLSGSVDYYNSTTRDLLWSTVIPSTNGFTAVLSNIGRLRNSGVEVVLNAMPVKTRNFEWTIGVNFAANKNKIVSLLGEDKDGDGKEDDLVASGLFIGEPIGTIYDYQIDGIWQLADQENGSIMKGYYPGTYRIKDQDNSGDITAENDRVILGHREPAFTIGIKNMLKYRGFDLSFFINIVNGGKNGYMAYNKRPDYIGNSVGNAENNNWYDCYDYWSPRNPDAKFATAWSSPAIDAERVQQRNFVRLQDLSLGYTFDCKPLKDVGIDNLRLFVSGQNLLTSSKWDGWDPEAGLGVSSNAAYPVMRSYSFGINISFKK